MSGLVCTAPRCPSLGPTARCTFLGCTSAPVHRVEPAEAGAMHWHACRKHLAGMVKAFKFGAGMDAAATVYPIRGKSAAAGKHQGSQPAAAATPGRISPRPDGATAAETTTGGTAAEAVTLGVPRTRPVRPDCPYCTTDSGYGCLAPGRCDTRLGPARGA